MKLHRRPGANLGKDPLTSSWRPSPRWPLSYMASGYHGNEGQRPRPKQAPRRYKNAERSQRHEKLRRRRDEKISPRNTRCIALSLSRVIDGPIKITPWQKNASIIITQYEVIWVEFECIMIMLGRQNMIVYPEERENKFSPYYTRSG